MKCVGRRTAAESVIMSRDEHATRQNSNCPINRRSYEETSRRPERQGEKKGKSDRRDGLYWRRIGFMRQLLLHTTVALSANARAFVHRIERRNILPINTILSSRNFKWCRCTLAAFSDRSSRSCLSRFFSFESLLSDRTILAVISRRLRNQSPILRVFPPPKPVARKLFYDPFAPLLISPWRNGKL